MKKKAKLRHVQVSQEELAGMGSGRVAYIREISPAEVADYIVDDFDTSTEIKLWAVIAADGTPIALTESHSAALANVWEAELTALSLH